MFSPMQIEQQELIKLTEFELKRLDDLKREKGWNPWILQVAIAALIWSAVEPLANPHAWKIVLLYWAAATLVLDFGRSLVRALSETPREGRLGFRVYPMNRLLGASRPLLFLKFFREIGVGWAVLYSGVLHGGPKYLWMAFFAAGVFGSMGILFGSFTDRPFGWGGNPSKAARRVLAVTNLLSLVAMAILVAQLWRPLLDAYSPVEVKLALLFFGITEITAFLLTHPTHDPMRSNLVEIRRALALGEVEGNDARERLESAIYGMRIAYYLQPYVSVFLAQATELAKLQEQIAATWAAIEKILKADPIEERAELHRAYGEAKSLSHKVTGLIDEMRRLTEQINNRSALASALHSGAFEEIKSLQESMSAQLKAAIERNERTVDLIGAHERQIIEILRLPEPDGTRGSETG